MHFTAPPPCLTHVLRLAGRRRLLTALACTLGLSSATALGQTAYYNFDEASGPALDIAGNGHAGTLDGATRGTGILNGGASFDGANDDIEIADATGLNITGAITMSVWIKNPVLPNTNGQIKTLMSREYGNGTPPNSQSYYLDLFYNGTAVQLRAGAYTAADNDFVAAVVSGLADSQWHHLAAVYDPGTGSTNDAWFLYVDGHQVATEGTGVSGAFMGTGKKLFLGSAGPLGRFYEGLMDEVGLWPRTLTALQIQTLYNFRNAVSFPLELQSHFLEGLDKSTLVQGRNAATLQAWANGGWTETREQLQLVGDFYYVNHPVEWPARTGLPTVRGDGGEPIYHPESQYSPSQLKLLSRFSPASVGRPTRSRSSRSRILTACTGSTTCGRVTAGCCTRKGGRRRIRCGRFSMA